ncbi:hypothetical protein F4778DRAFT_778842 [Xylariomycetidae sp. FL2044]|nr:hypothetical protein F4778DRAFT_778842 [Xylariomycetidae sp. FL2044]
MAPSTQSTPQPRPTAVEATSSASAPNANDPRAGNDEIPIEELKKIAAKSLQTGAVAGGIGLLVGAGAGIMRSAPPTLFAVVAGLQWFTLGSSYIASRSLLWHAWGGEENLSPSDLVKAGAVAGSVSGMVGGMFRGPRNIIPGMLFFGSLGAGTTFLTQQLKDRESKPKTKTSWLDSKWSPMQKLTDEEYEQKLEEKILRIRAEIAIVDEHITALKASKEPPKTAAEATTTSKK